LSSQEILLPYIKFRQFPPTSEVHMVIVIVQVLFKMGKLYVQRRNDCRRMKRREWAEIGSKNTLINYQRTEDPPYFG
jgi:hypothetical protein